LIEEIKLEPKYHPCFKITFEGLTGDNFKVNSERFPRDFIKLDEGGKPYFEGEGGEKVFTDEFSEELTESKGDFFDALADKLGEEKWREFNDKLGEFNTNDKLLTEEQMQTADTQSTKPENVTKMDEQETQLNEKGEGTWKAWVEESVKKLAEKGGKLALMAGVGFGTLEMIAKNRQGCYSYNLGTGRLMEKVDSSTSASQCRCNGFCEPGYVKTQDDPPCLSKSLDSYTNTKMEQCDNYCKNMPNYTPLLDWSECGLSCSCMRKKVNGKATYELQDKNHQVGFKVVQGNILSAVSWMLSSVGYAITDVVDEGFKVIDTLANKVADFFKQWWVIAIIVVVALVVILVPTLITQLPKGKGGGGVSGGGHGWSSGSRSFSGVHHSGVW
jgi:hypothetical protein